MFLAGETTNELVIHKLESIDKEIKRGNKIISDKINAYTIDDIDLLKKMLVEAETKILSNQLGKQQINIMKFRAPNIAPSASKSTSEADD